jgi:hypothetical protein
MLKVFCSGSCRLLTAIHNGHLKLQPIHSMFDNFTGINFLGKLHNIKQHIQFIKWINGNIEIPKNILDKFLTSYGLYNNSRDGMDASEVNPIKKKNIETAFYDCDCYIFEICSLKIYEKSGYQVQFELTNDYECSIQSETELYSDLKILRDLIPEGKKIIFQIHFRPNIIHNNNTISIEKREIIYNVINNFCSMNKNTYLYDPSVVLNKDNTLFDGDTHFNIRGLQTSFEYLYDNFIKK